jgi:hypothetical protein
LNTLWKKEVLLCPRHTDEETVGENVTFVMDTSATTWGSSFCPLDLRNSQSAGKNTVYNQSTPRAPMIGSTHPLEPVLGTIN